MPAMSLSPKKEEYLENVGKTMLLGGYWVEVSIHTIEGRQGSYEKGFKFTTNKYGMLYNTLRHEYSVNHGMSWHPDKKSAMKSKGKVKLESSKRGEFAFDAIQKINRDYDPSFKWRP